MTLPRDALVGYLRSQLMGPVGGADEQLTESPHGRYAIGGLYPREVAAEGELQDEEIDERGGGDTDSGTQGPPDDPVALSSQWMPASVGLSLLLHGGRLIVEVWAARYERQGEENSWHRRAISERAQPEVLTLDAPAARALKRMPVLEGRGEIVVLWRPVQTHYLVTVTLVNNSPAGIEKRTERAENTLFQAGFRCRPGSEGAITQYPTVEARSPDPEERELALQYRRHRTFAVGHGCAAAWDEPGPAGTAWVETDWIPTYEASNLIPRREARDVLQLRTLSEARDADELLDGLREFARGYRDWIRELHTRDDVPHSLRSARDRIIARVEEAAARIEEGIGLLRNDRSVFAAFQLANEVLRISMVRGKGVSGAPRSRDSGNPDDTADWSSEPAWYPFQLAFQLSVLPSLVDSGHEHRDAVDLLWFPTGGGKTEAYLGLSALAIFLRRLGGGSPGTTVLTRYTLRLLTTQQFRRTATMICSAEMLRRQRSDLGAEPIRLGLWIGRSSTPNTCAQAKERYQELIEADRPVSPFQLDRCPWCATQLVPDIRSEDGGDYGFDAEAPNDFRIFCPTSACPFHAALPVQVVDEVLYLEPPEFIVATVDKFAQLAFNPSAGALLGAGPHAGSGPSLVIQDELHLLSGPLGTMVGLYESALQEIIRHNGGRPKIVASTATIRRASDQARGLFGREVRVFPPPGTEYGDSYFASRDRERPGRLHVGVLSQVHTPSFTLIQTAAALAQGRNEVDELGPAEFDAYGTLVAYHNSLRELGKTVTFARDDIPARMEFYASSSERRRELGAGSVVELTSNITDDDLGQALTRLERSPEEGGAAFVACTNMLSVGVDVQRLGLMVVNGQPKTTSEYIQATSRVGRGQVPGVVVTVYSPTKPRDRSHYEQFRSFHQSLYRWVEPTSVTPFALPARNRALHATLVILARHVLGLASEERASDFRRDLPGLKDAVDSLVASVGRIDPDEAASTRDDLERLIDDWHQRAVASGQRLRYARRSKQYEDLLKTYGTSGEGWATPTSMRNVDRVCLIKVQGAS